MFWVLCLARLRYGFQARGDSDPLEVICGSRWKIPAADRPLFGSDLAMLDGDQANYL